MSALNAPSSWRQADRGASGRADGHDTMIGFSISPTGSGTWAWRACDQSGRDRASVAIDGEVERLAMPLRYRIRRQALWVIAPAVSA